MIKPNFFIVGAPKCGTTAMNDYLAAHPDIFMARKERHYFGSDLDFTFQRLDRETYLALFDGWNGERRIGEASVWYLYSKCAATEIKTFNPEAKIIIMLRNPVDMLYSNYSQFLFNGNENLPTFKDALAAEVAREQGERIPPEVMFVSGLFYRKTARYTEQVQRYFNAFERENVYVIIFDDFKADTASTYQKTLKFLGVNDTYTTNFEVVNPNKRVRSIKLRQFLRKNAKCYRWYQVFALSFLRVTIPGILRKRINLGLRRWNTVYTMRQPMLPETRRQLQAEFLPEIEQLSELLERDLTYWCRTE